MVYLTNGGNTEYIHFKNTIPSLSPFHHTYKILALHWECRYTGWTHAQLHCLLPWPLICPAHAQWLSSFSLLGCTRVLITRALWAFDPDVDGFPLPLAALAYPAFIAQLGLLGEGLCFRTQWIAADILSCVLPLGGTWVPLYVRRPQDKGRWSV